MSVTPSEHQAAVTANQEPSRSCVRENAHPFSSVTPEQNSPAEELVQAPGAPQPPHSGSPSSASVQETAGRENGSLLPVATPKPTVLPAPPAKELLKVDPILARIEALTDAERLELMAYEEVVDTSERSFVEKGLALLNIREKDLTREEYDSFEHYCRLRWNYGRRSVVQLIAAAQLVRRLRAVSSQILPSNEYQIRPLATLPIEDGISAWNLAVQKASRGQLTVGVVKNAMKELNLAPPPKPVA